eukprot:CAMPEP_0119317520 /NCGR_PEP_ID=MMETSP1333-20130426/43369_1 /TAXON_ID=418940 /ORGANISM="Scyphosphaera apsteinii, Strain RCC1455" /LENGTH=364 /DNA_ID=CAMNT_0007323467 /DNA_START=149 /DNA_END=1243 /DNA_ORIENTATION=+
MIGLALFLTIGLLFLLSNIALMVWLDRQRSRGGVPFHMESEPVLNKSSELGSSTTTPLVKAPPRHQPSAPTEIGTQPKVATRKLKPTVHGNRHYPVYTPLPEEIALIPHYEHDPDMMELDPAIILPSPGDCAPQLRANSTFFTVSMYSFRYQAKAERLKASCEAVGVCCATSLVPSHAFGSKEGTPFFRSRFIASKPLFVLRVLQKWRMPIVWLDIDLEFFSYPDLFEAGAWGESRDVLIWNWQANVSNLLGRRLKMASGVFFINATERAEALLVAWAEAMAFANNSAAPDDQTMDELVNKGGWIDRLVFGWLPARYLRMSARHPAIVPVIEHDRGNMPGQNGYGLNFKPVLPPVNYTVHFSLP